MPAPLGQPPKPPLPPLALPVAQPVTAQEAGKPTQRPEEALVFAVPATQPRKASPLAVRLMGLLKDKQNLTTAMLLREVFDRPLCQRRGPRG
jgi:hypothetical protein